MPGRRSGRAAAKRAAAALGKSLPLFTLQTVRLAVALPFPQFAEHVVDYWDSHDCVWILCLKSCVKSLFLVKVARPRGVACSYVPVHTFSET